MEPRVSGCESQGRAIDPRACDADGASANEGAESEKRLIKKCRELNSEIVANAAKVQTALKLSEEDQSTIAALKKEIEKAWKLVDASHEKEARAKETIQQLKLEITNLSRLVEQGAGLSLGQEQTVCLCTGHATRGWLSGAGCNTLVTVVFSCGGWCVQVNELLKQKEELIKERDAQVRLRTLHHSICISCSASRGDRS
jgi:hypothetical protein